MKASVSVFSRVYSKSKSSYTLAKLAEYKIYFWCYLVLWFMISGCFPGRYQKLQTERKDNHSDELLIDGFYYGADKNGYFELDGSDSAYVYLVLYRNGVVLGPVSGSKGLEDIKDDFTNEYFLKQIKKLRVYWGVYEIEEGKLTIETWYPGSLNYYRTTRTAQIIDTATIRFENSNWGGLMKFYPYSIKPDSTNSFIE